MPPDSESETETPMHQQPGDGAARPFPIVAIGASAGGLEACSKLLDVLPPASGMAFVVVQHLDPTHESLLVTLLGAHTAMPVVQAADGMALRPDHVHVIPPGSYLAVRQDTLLLSQPSAQRGARMPFDYLLKSLATNAGGRTVAVVLSGSGSDGSQGVSAVRDAGGLVVAQDPMEAGYDGMPRSAVATGAVDKVLPLAAIPAALAGFAQRPTARAADPATGKPSEDWLGAIVDLLRKKAAHDFRLYKPGTLRRRVEQRMGRAGIEATEFHRYHTMLTTDPAERELLVKDLLINVTGFFRDPKVFALLAAETIPALLQNHPDDRPLRVWTVGCSTGEETYSLAMLFLEQVSAGDRPIKLQFFASDIDTDAIAVAREGCYPQSIAADVSPERLARFFTRDGANYRVVPELRAAVVFTVQDVLSDPPFSRLDMVSCRNLLIYLLPEAQARVLALFHFALRAGGLLLLGGAETIGEATDRFEVISKPARLYRQVGRARSQDYPFELAAPGSRDGAAGKSAAPPPRQVALAELCRRLVLEAYAPAAVLINARSECLFLLGPTERYLRIAPGQPSFDLLTMARQETRTKLRAAIQQARKSNAGVTVAGGRITTPGGITAFSIVVRPISHDGEQLLLICFVDNPPPRAAGPASDPTAPASAPDQTRVVELEAELESTRAELQGAIHNLELADEEQRAITEETLSANEEFQSTNEELMTSKEELQSLNEELTALNGQLQETLERQRVAGNDLQNVLYSTDVATLFLDTELRIRLFTPATRALFNVIPSDIGRKLADLRTQIPDPELLDDARAVLRTHTAIEREIEGDAGAWLSRRIMPYRTQHDGVEGVVITLADVTERRRTAVMMAEAKRQAELATRAKSQFLVTASHDLRQPLQTLTLLQGMLAEAVRGQQPAEKLVERLDTIVHSTTTMLNALLAANQIEAGVVTPNITTFPVNEMLQRLHAEFLTPAQAKGLELRVVPCSCLVTTDQVLLEQILRNLLSNALKYTQRGRVLLGCRQHEDGLRIEVWDTGSGIPPGALNTIFEEYRQLNTPASAHLGGLGLGLSIVRRLGLLLGHPITVQSRIGRGSVFAVGIAGARRLRPVAMQPAPPPAAHPGDGQQADGQFRGRILLVEDDTDLRELLAAGLTERGHTVLAAADGPAMLKLAADGPAPDLILTDFNLPRGGDGLRLTAELRRRFARRIPAVILTGDISTGTLRDISAADCVRLAKPVRMRDLAAAIQHELAAAQHAPAPDTRALLHVVDDDPAIAAAIRELFEVEGLAVQTYSSGEAFLDAFRPGREGCLLIDLRLPGITGLEVMRRLRAAGHHLPSIVITGHGDLPMAVRAMRAGALDFIVKPISTAELRSAVANGLARAHDTTAQAAWREAAAQHLAGLTERQREIMHLVLAGQPNKNIAADLGISQRTVENHRAAIMQKTGAGSLPALARLAFAATADTPQETLTSG
jgi:two-component system CheB/CheR fusion protein